MRGRRVGQQPSSSSFPPSISPSSLLHLDPLALWTFPISSIRSPTSSPSLHADLTSLLPPLSSLLTSFLLQSPRPSSRSPFPPHHLHQRSFEPSGLPMVPRSDPRWSTPLPRMLSESRSSESPPRSREPTSMRCPRLPVSLSFPIRALGYERYGWSLRRRR